MSEYTQFAYDKIFDPEPVQLSAEKQSDEPGDQRRAPVYVYTEEIVLAVNVALATGRPLLVRGASGTGKSTLARNAADALGWRYYERVITSRTRAQDLLWEIDLLRRLHDAQRQDDHFNEDYTPYVIPGPLWWAFDPESARRRGGASTRDDVQFVEDPWQGRSHPRAVVLLDEIDKADPDEPNNLLVPLGSLQFQVDETGVPVRTTREHAPLVFITTNEERELPAAFLRRCVEVRLSLPNLKRLIEIGKAHFPDEDVAFARDVARRLAASNGDFDESVTPEISPAEFLDTMKAVQGLGVDMDSDDTWRSLSSITLWKHGRTSRTSR